MTAEFSSKNRGTCSTTTMPLTTRTVAKGIPPRLHQPKSKGKAANARTSKPKKSGKRAASESELESESEDSEPVKKKTNRKKRQRVDIASEAEVELVHENAEPAEKEVEEADAGGDGGQDNQEEVSKDFWVICKKLTSS